MSKIRLFLLSLSFGIFAFGLMAMQPPQVIAAIGALLIGLICFLVWLYRVMRDRRLVHHAMPPLQATIRQENPNDSLFIPEPRYK